MNRIAAAIGRVESQVAKVPAGKLPALEETARFGIAEYVAAQELKSAACAGGTLTLEEAQTVYGILGQTLEYFHAQPVACRIVAMKVTQELMGAVLQRA